MVSEIAGLGAQDTDTVSVPSVAAPFGPLSNSKQTPVLVWSMVDPGAKEMQVRSRVGDRRESGLVVLNPRLVAVDPERTLPAIASAPLR